MFPFAKDQVVRRRMLVGLLMALPLAAHAQSTQSVITAPPSSMKSDPNSGSDSTTSAPVDTPDVQPSTVSVPWNYVISCTPSSTSHSTTGTCPAGQTYNGVGDGPATFTQTYTTTVSCPDGQYAPGTTSNSTPSPAASSVCSTPVVTCTPSSSSTGHSQGASCPSGYETAGGATTFTQTDTTTVTTTCATPYSTPQTSSSTTAWSPSASSVCTTAIQNATASLNGSYYQFYEWGGQGLDELTFISTSSAGSPGNSFGQGGASYTFTDSKGTVHTINHYNVSIQNNGSGLSSFSIPALPQGGSFAWDSGNSCGGDGYYYTGGTSNPVHTYYAGAPDNCASWGVYSNFDITVELSDPNSSGNATSATLQACDASGFCTQTLTIPAGTRGNYY
jgi:hypothetical protein